MKFNLKEVDYKFLDVHLIQPLKHKGLKVYVFGSRATGTNHPFSDVDVLIDGHMSDDIERTVVGIREFFEESNFPYKIDLVFEKNLAHSYRARVMSERIEI